MKMNVKKIGTKEIIRINCIFVKKKNYQLLMYTNFSFNHKKFYKIIEADRLK